MNFQKFESDMERSRRTFNIIFWCIMAAIAVIGVIVLAAYSVVGMAIYKSYDRVGEVGMQQALTEMWCGKNPDCTLPGSGK